MQAKRAANAVARQVRLRGSAAILTGRLFDDRGNRMSPTHANKRGVRYRYYVSHALLQNRKAEAGSIARVPAPEIETLVCDGVRRHLAAMVPEEAEVVRTIFTRYLELGSMGALIAELDRQGIRTKVNGRRDGRRSGGIRFGVGSLAHLLKNRFYIGEVTYRGEVHRGEHEPILGRDVFEAVQAKRAANAVARQVRLRGSAAILTGRLFDDRGNRMSPTHANKRGVRYRYYVSHAILQNRKAEAGSIARVPAPEIETLVCDGVRRHLAAMMVWTAPDGIDCARMRSLQISNKGDRPWNRLAELAWTRRNIFSSFMG